MNLKQRKRLREKVTEEKLPTYLQHTENVFEHRGSFFYIDDVEDCEEGVRVIALDVSNMNKVFTTIVTEEDMCSWCIDNDLHKYTSDSSDHNGNHVQKSWTITVDAWYEEVKHHSDVIASFLNDQGEIIWEGRSWVLNLLSRVFSGIGREAAL